MGQGTRGSASFLLGISPRAWSCAGTSVSQTPDTRWVVPRNEFQEKLRPRASGSVREQYHSHLVIGVLVKKILLIGPVAPPYGGVASVIQDLVHSRLSQEYAFEIFPRPAPFLPGTEGFFRRRLFRLKRVIRYVKRLKSEEYELVHIHISGSIILRSLTFIVPARFFCKNLIVQIHGMNWKEFCEDGSRFMRRVQTRILCMASRIVVTYDLLAENLRAAGCETEIRVLNNRIPDIPRPDPEAVEAVRKQFGLGRESFVVLFIGDVSRAKGIFDVLEGVPALAEQDDGIRILVIGQEKKPREMAAAVETVQTRNLGKWVKFVGAVPRDKITLFFALADTFLLPSHTEAMPISILEAMRAGVPIIASRVGGIPEMIEDGVNGILINPCRADEIVQAVLKLREDPDLRQRLGTGCRQAFEDRYEFSRGVEELERLYRFD
jgi:glycosyltransferase involved in cell wall biosynthesis